MADIELAPGARDADADTQSFEALLGIGGLVKGGRVAANWLPDGRFWFAEGAPVDTRIRVFDPKARSVSDLFDTSAVRAALADVIGREPPYRGLPFDIFYYGVDGAVHFSFEAADYRYDPEAKWVTRLPAPALGDLHYGVDLKSRTTPKMMQRPYFFSDMAAVPEMLSPDGRRFASLKDGDIYIRSVSDGRYDRLTSDAEPHYGWDVESTRLGISSAGSLMHLTVQPWSPDSTRLYATRFDERGVRPFHRIRYLRHFDEVEMLRMTRCGDALAVAQPYVVDVMSGRQVRLELDVRDAFILLLGWSGDGKTVFLFHISRDMREAKVLIADAETGEARELFGERGDTFIRIQHEVVGGRTGCWLLPNGRGFLWESERSGWKHLYHYDPDGKLVRQLTSGEWPMAEVLATDPNNDEIYFSARIDQTRPYDVHVCRVNLGGGQVEQLTSGPGLHDAQFAPDYAYFVDTAQSPSSAPRSRVIGADATLWHELPEADITALKAAGWTPPEEVCVKAADGETDLHGLIFKPRDFDPAQRYPVVEYIYGGPQASMVDRKFLPMAFSKMQALNHALPQLGYICVVVDARGTPCRSKKFQDEVFGNWRRSVTADHAAALRGLAATRPWMNLDRVGIWGHSWGGYFTTANMFDNPGLYRAGLASAPGYDPYNLFIYEPYLGGVPSPSTQAAYRDAELYPDASKLQGALMMVAGTNDLGVWHSALTMSNALVDAGKSHELVPMTNAHHGWGGAQDSYFVKKLTGHFERYLQRGEEIVL